MSDPKNDAAGDLLIQEVDEELRREQYAKLWQRYGNLIIGAAMAIVLVVAGHEAWKSWQHKQQLEAASLLDAAESKADAADPKAAADALVSLSQQSGGAGVVAQLRRGSLLAAAGDDEGAVRAYEVVAANSSAPALYRDLAVLRIALLSADSADPKALEARLYPLTNHTSPWRHSALELTALLAQRQNDIGRAKELWQRLADDAQAPQGVRARAAEMLAANGGREKPKG